jgi:hypothetical protein
MESQNWKRSSFKVQSLKLPDLSPRQLAKTLPKDNVRELLDDSQDSEIPAFFDFSGETLVGITHNSPVQVPLFPKLPFGKHSDMAKSTQKFKQLSLESEEVVRMKIESGRIKRAVNEKNSAKNGLINSIRLNLKSLG